MERKVIITECMERYLTVLLENGEVVELHYNLPDSQESCRVGDIYVGKVTKILPNIQGAFIQIKKGLECYYSLTEKYTPIFISKPGKAVLNVGDELLVQVQKEALKTKQPQVTGNLNFTGKYVVLTSGNKTVGASSKLSSKRRKELILWGTEIAKGEFGLIFRTNAGDASWNILQAEIEKIKDKWKRVITYGTMRTCYSCIYQAHPPAIEVLRDFNQFGLKEIIVDSAVKGGELYQTVEAFLEEEQPEDLSLLRAYQDISYPLAKCYNLERITQLARKQNVWMKSGAYLVIQPTEALTVIDVNSGKNMKKKGHFADINREAAREAARQIRLRNLSGIIIVDFINLASKKEKEELLAYFQHELSKDRNPGKVVDFTQLQLVEVTRKKVRKTLEECLC